MNARSVTFIIIAIVIVAAAGTYFWLRSGTAEESVHLHAGFNLYINGEKIDLADWKYMHEEPCSVESHDEVTTAEDEQIEKAHLHDLVGDVVHVHRAGATWGDLFQNIGITFDGTVVGYTTDGIIENVLQRQISAYDRVLIVEGELTDPITKVADVPSVDRIKEVENSSETCGS